MRPVWPRAKGVPRFNGMSGVVSFRPAASTISRLIHVAYGSPVIALMIRPSRPKPWLEYFMRVPGAMTSGSLSSARSSASFR